jgi:hypothetical protein
LMQGTSIELEIRYKAALHPGRTRYLATNP